MSEEVSFGYLLKRLLVIRNWSAAKLAREINLDPSYVRKWIRGERVPSLKTNHVERIANSLCYFLDLNNKLELKEAYIKALGEMNFYNGKDKPFIELIALALSKAQLYSLKISSNKKKLKLLSKKNDFFYTDIASNYTFNETSEIPSVIEGKKTIIYTIIELIRKAIYSENREDNNVYITSLGEEYIFNSFLKLRDEWSLVIKKALDDGWNINHLWRINNNYNRSIEIVKNLKNFLGYKGMYVSHYFKKYETLIPPYELIIISNIGALICFSSEVPDSIDTAFFFRDKEKIKALTMNYHQLKSQSKPLTKVINEKDYFDLTTEKDKKPGSSFIYSSNLDVLTFPYELWFKYLKETFKDNERELLEHTSRIKSRIEDFKEQVLKYDFKFIFPLETLEYIINTGKYYRDTKYKNPTPKDIVTHLSYIVYLLEKYENLDIAFMDEKIESDFPYTCFEIKENKTVIMDITREINVRDNHNNVKFTTSNEEILVTAFTNYFMTLWNRITPKLKNKEYIIKLLKEQIEWFSDKYIN